MPISMPDVAVDIPILLFLHFVIGLVLAIFWVFQPLRTVRGAPKSDKSVVQPAGTLVGLMRWLTVLFWLVAFVPILLDIIVLGQCRAGGADLVPTGLGWAYVPRLSTNGD